MNNKHHKSVVDAARENLQTNKQTIQQTFRKQKIKQLTKWMNGRMNTWDIRWQKEEEIKKKRKKGKSDMIEWEIDETYTEYENERRMSGHIYKEMQGFFYIQKRK